MKKLITAVFTIFIFSLNAQTPTPGGVSSNLRLWLKADAEAYSDAGTTLATDGQEVQELHDQSGNSYDATDNGATGPDWDADGVNFNPALDFNDASSENLEISSGIFGTDAINDLFIYAVFADDEDRNDKVFHEAMASSRSVGVHCAWGDERVIWDMGNQTDGQGRVEVNWGADYGITHLWAFGSSTVTGTPNGTKKYILRDNNVLDSGDPSTANSATGNNQIFFLGSGVNTQYLNGRIAEFIVYDGIPTETQEDQIQTYLAVKYGITLAGEDYTDSDGSTVIWDYSANSAYHYDIAGIGADATSGLDQRQSKSINPDAMVTMSTEAIGSTNAGISTALTDGTYLLWGNNNARDDSDHDDMPSGYSGRLAREWKVEMTGTVADVHVEFDLSVDAHITLAGDAAADFYLLIDADGDFTSGATAIAASSFASNKVTFDDVDFTDGYYFTLATQQPGPGGVANHLEVWFDAGVQSHNTGTTQATDGQNVDNWHDQSGNDHDATSNQGDASWDADGMNFNPTVYFDGSAENYIISGGIIDDDDTIHNLFAYFAGTTNDITERVIFDENTRDISGTRRIQLYNNSGGNTVFQKGRDAASSGQVSGASGYVVGESFITSAGATDSTNTPQSATKYITRNNVVVATGSGTNVAEGTGSNFFLGSNKSNDADYYGNMAELILLNTIPTAAEEDQIQSYLAIKYGITLDAMDYLSANGTVVWDNSTYSAYHNGIAGIGRDDLGNLLQKQSKSANYDAIVTMSTEAIAATNAANSTTLTDGAYLLWGHNGATSASADADLPTGYTGRLNREWVVEMTGTVSNVHIEFDLSGQNTNLMGDAAGDFYLLTDADGDFTSGATATVATSFSGNKVTFDDFNFTDGQYFTLATQQASPGGVGFGLHLWLEAETQCHNTGTTQATDAQTVDNWHDQSGNEFDISATLNAAVWDQDGINFRPSLSFDGNDNYTHASGILGTDTMHNAFMYSVNSFDNTGSGNTVFHENSSGTDHNLLFSRGSSNNFFAEKGNDNTSNGRIQGSWGGTTTVPYLWSAGMAENTSTPAGTEKSISRNNNSLDTQAGTDDCIGLGEAFYFGSNKDGSNDFNGKISEVLIYNTILSAAEEDRVQSYLAIKYGLTLASMDYLSSDGTVVWDNSTYSSYHNDIAGIGRDDAGNLLQKQSKSIETDAIVTMSTEAVAATNAANSTTLTDGAYLLWGNDNDDDGTIDVITSELPTGYSERLDREWVVEMTGTVSDVHIEFDISGTSLNTGYTFFLLTDADANFASGATAIEATSANASTVTFDDVTLTDGQYFTLASSALGPGGVSSNLHLWLKADAEAYSDAGTTLATDGVEVDEWHDQEGGTVLDAKTPGNGPDWDADAINFNPALDFLDSESDYLSITNGIFETTTKNDIFVYMVATIDETSSNHVGFHEDLASSTEFTGYLDWGGGLDDIRLW